MATDSFVTFLNFNTLSVKVIFACVCKENEDTYGPQQECLQIIRVMESKRLNEEVEWNNVIQMYETNLLRC